MKSMKKKLLPLLIVLLGSGLITQATADNGNAPVETPTNLPSQASNAQSQTLPGRKLIDANEQLVLALSRRPAVVGVALLQQEAEGLRKLPPQAIKAWRQGRLDF